ncbi:hypothetical protein PYW07_012496 [Mythimna separata]|uniref:Uncharacterized protein n=1 Tax=Mythimna separata TaxID=271217 RepID=A0AAD7YMF9_MYTSE|nr:hypothetical protein PYW07_012496 [Mythimna separata]
MFTLWMLLISSTLSTLASETSTSPDSNITTLYPVFNKTFTRNEIHSKDNDTEPRPSDKKARIKEAEAKSNDTETKVNNTETIINQTETKSKPATQSWKIESGFAPSNLTEGENKDKDGKERQEKKQMLKDFKPSQHLGSFFDDDSAELIKTPALGPVAKKPASGFVSTIKDDYPPHAAYNKIPKEVYYTHQQFPYKFEDTIYTKIKPTWTDSMESKPTVEVPVRVPAGGLYQSPDAFKEKPHSEEEYGLEYHEDEKEHAVKKRVNSWHNLLRLVTAFIPVGLIISALTPSIVTIHNVDDNTPPSSLPYRRSDPVLSGGAPISERCRRRLLCELHSERNYVPAQTLPRRAMKHCYKIHCEDTEALWRTLRWLFTYNQNPGDGDQRGRLLT